MPRDLTRIQKTAEVVLAEQSVELAAARARQLLAVGTKAATGTGHLDQTFALDVRFRLVFVRCHFAGAPGTGPLAISVDSGRDPVYDARLYTVTRAGTNRDVNFRVPAEESQDPSPWTFQTGDAVRIQWTNPSPGNIAWGLEVGLAMAS